MIFLVRCVYTRLCLYIYRERERVIHVCMLCVLAAAFAMRVRVHTESWSLPAERSVCGWQQSFRIFSLERQCFGIDCAHPTPVCTQFSLFQFANRQLSNRNGAHLKREIIKYFFVAVLVWCDQASGSETRKSGQVRLFIVRISTKDSVNKS